MVVDAEKRASRLLEQSLQLQMDTVYGLFQPMIGRAKQLIVEQNAGFVSGHTRTQWERATWSFHDRIKRICALVLMVGDERADGWFYEANGYEVDISRDPMKGGDIAPLTTTVALSSPTRNLTIEIKREKIILGDLHKGTFLYLGSVLISRCTGMDEVALKISDQEDNNYIVELEHNVLPMADLQVK